MTAPDALDEWFRAELAATMRPCPEVSYGERIAQRKADRAMQQETEERTINMASTPRPPLVDGMSPGCAETGPRESSEGVPECA